MLLCLTITHWLWILLLKVWLLLDGGFKWIVLRSDKELIARNKSPEQWRKATHGVARRYRLLRWGNGVLDCQDGLEFYFILFCRLLTMMRDSGSAGRWPKDESRFRSHLHIACLYSIKNKHICWCSCFDCVAVGKGSTLNNFTFVCFIFSHFFLQNKTFCRRIIILTFTWCCVCFEYSMALTSNTHMCSSPQSSCKFGQWKTQGLWELLFISTVKRRVEL